MYEDLIKALRDCANDSCEHCTYLKQDENCFVKFCGILQDAADAIEAQDKHILTLQHEMMEEAESHTALVERLNEQIEVLSKMEKTTRWIPVRERLPEMYEAVLVVNDDGICHTAERTDSFDTKDDWAIHYCLYDADAWDEDENGVITHWMPLPEPPKEE